jgi:hypothetical protein
VGKKGVVVVCVVSSAGPAKKQAKKKGKILVGSRQETKKYCAFWEQSDRKDAPYDAGKIRPPVEYTKAE